MEVTWFILCLLYLQTALLLGETLQWMENGSYLRAGNKTDFSLVATILGPTYLWNRLKYSFWSKAMAKKTNKTKKLLALLTTCTNDKKFPWLVLFLNRHIFFCYVGSWFSFSDLFARSQDILFCHQAPRTVIMVVIFISNLKVSQCFWKWFVLV